MPYIPNFPNFPNLPFNFQFSTLISQFFLTFVAL